MRCEIKEINQWTKIGKIEINQPLERIKEGQWDARGKGGTDNLNRSKTGDKTRTTC